LTPVVPFKLTRKEAAKVISKIAKDTTKITWVDKCSHGEWEERVSYLQAVRCLESGDFLRDPAFNEKTGCWECEMYRFAAGQDIHVTAVISADKQELYVINICDEQ
jgi:protein-arginine kinase activator protein McsA